MPNTPLPTQLRGDELLAAIQTGRIAGRFYPQKGEAVRQWAIKKGQLFCFPAQREDRYLHVMSHESRQQSLAVDGTSVVEITWSARPGAGQVHVSAAP